MKNHPLFIGSVIVTLMAGCSKDEAPQAATPSPEPPSSVAAMPSLDQGGAAQPAAQQGAQGAAVAPAVPAYNFDDKPFGTDGQPISDLELLNDALEAFSNRELADQPAMPRFKTMEEQEAWMAKGPARPKLTSLNDLVKYGVVKALPQPPAGKQFVYVPEKNAVELQDVQ